MKTLAELKEHGGTPLEWFQKVKDKELRERLIEKNDPENSHKGDIYCSLGDAILCGFIWCNDLYDYWVNVHISAENGEIELTDHITPSKNLRQLKVETSMVTTELRDDGILLTIDLDDVGEVDRIRDQLPDEVILRDERVVKLIKWVQNVDDADNAIFDMILGYLNEIE